MLSAVALLALTIDDSGAGRAFGAALGIFVVPGLAWTGLLGVRAPSVEFGLALVLSGAIETLLGVGLVTAGAWSPMTVLVGTVAVTVGGLVACEFTASRRVEARV